MSNPVIRISLAQYLHLADARHRCEVGEIDEECLTFMMYEILGEEICDTVADTQERGQVTEFALKDRSAYTESELDEYGYLGLVQIGFTPKLARDRIAACHVDESALKIYRRMQQTEEGRTLLDENAALWRKDGVEPPWAGLL